MKEHTLYSMDSRTNYIYKLYPDRIGIEDIIKRLEYIEAFIEFIYNDLYDDIQIDIEVMKWDIDSNLNAITYMQFEINELKDAILILQSEINDLKRKESHSIVNRIRNFIMKVRGSKT